MFGKYEAKMLLISVAVAALIFIGFLSLVGSPSEVETVIGLVISAVGFFVTFIIAWRMKSNSHEENQNEKIAVLERELALLKSKN